MPFRTDKKKSHEVGENIDIDKVTQQLYQQNVELSERNQILGLLKKIDDIVLGEETSTNKLIKKIGDVILAESNFPLVVIMKESADSKHFKTQSVSIEFDDEDLASELLRYNVELSQNQVALNAIHSGKIYITDKVDEFYSRSRKKDHILEVFDSQGINSLILCPLFIQTGEKGLLLFGSRTGVESVSEFKSSLAERIASSLSMAISSSELLHQIRETNKKLMALDEAKDEFISMASHQLRTPLTTIKGYLSMIIEGDMGKISKEQKTVLNNAFTSSQRMVYLISDLLNVSRLNTGKFIIEKADVDLIKVVADEVASLEQHFAAKNLEYDYIHPEAMPIMQLDEGKLRQVIMNFIDNAIYYTPEGGDIEIRLDVSDKQVEFRVIDSGIGVPKAAQAKLFAKFFRADNAQKVRPDGTGLGLFLARKVVIGHGGAIIFKSKEGEGSTFGFSLPL